MSNSTLVQGIGSSIESILNPSEPNRHSDSIIEDSSFPVESTTKPSKSAYRMFTAEAALKMLELPMGKHVGELHEKWAFPSDHLPIGVEVDGTGIMSWNILDPAYMRWVTELDSQGINGSMISDEDYKLEGSELTFREQHIINLLIESITSSTHPKSIVALQECSEASYAALSAQLPSSYDIVFADGNAIIYNKTEFTLATDPNNLTKQIFSADTRTILDVTFMKDNVPYRIINGHLPGDPNGPARVEFANYMLSTFSTEGVTMGMGDMNFNEVEMKEAFKKAASANHLLQSPFTQVSPYPTNTNPRPNLYSKAIDHFFIFGMHTYNVLNPDDVITGTEHMVDMLS